MSINQAVIMGRLTYNPELKSSATGKSVTRFQVAVDRQYQPKGQERQADFIDCVAWEKTAEFVHRYFQKGSMIALSGSIQTTSYTDKNGNSRKSIEIVASNVSFCGSKENGTQASTVPDINENNVEMIDDDGDLPF